MFRRRPALPPQLAPSWWAFHDCVDLIEPARRDLLARLPAGRVAPAPIDGGLDALDVAVAEVRARMDRWRVPELEDRWQRCVAVLDEAQAAIPVARRVASSTRELDELLGAIQDVVDPLAAFADAEREWRRRWRPPSADLRPGTGSDEGARRG